MTVTPATITVAGYDPSPVQFNPASLRITTTNQIDDEHPNQVSKPTSFKLDVELIFDSSEYGCDITLETWLLTHAATASAQGATPQGGSGGASRNRRAAAEPSLKEVTLAWGPNAYTGFIESLSETLDYFTSDGVPLRSTLQVSIKGLTDRFHGGDPQLLISANFGPNAVPALPEVVMAPAAAEGSANLKQRGLSAPGDNAAMRGIAAFNGMESMRGGTGAVAGAIAGASAGAGAGAGASAGAGAFAGASAGAGAGMAVGTGAQLQAAAGFAMAGGVSAGASAGFGMGASAGLSAGAGLGASVGVGMAAGAGAGIGIGGGIGLSGGIGAGAGIGAAVGIGIGGSGGGLGLTTSTSVTGFDGVTRTDTTASVTGLDGVTRTTSSSTSSTGGSFGSGSAGAMASAGAFAGLGTSRTSLPPSTFNLDSLLPPPLPATGNGANYDISGRVVSSDGQIAASYAAQSGVRVW